MAGIIAPPHPWSGHAHVGEEVLMQSMDDVERDYFEVFHSWDDGKQELLFIL